MKRPIVVTLVLAVVALAGCTKTSSHAADVVATHATTAATEAACAELATWDKRGKASVQALYADTGALAADAHAANSAGVAKAGRKLASDAIGAAALPLPPVDPSAWKTLTADYASAGTTIGNGDAVGAVPQLEAGSGAIAAFSAATGKCA